MARSRMCTYHTHATHTYHTHTHTQRSHTHIARTHTTHSPLHAHTTHTPHNSHHTIVTPHNKHITHTRGTQYTHIHTTPPFCLKLPLVSSFPDSSCITSSRKPSRFPSPHPKDRGALSLGPQSTECFIRSFLHSFVRAFKKHHAWSSHCDSAG